ncbi:MAG: hypothetical protein JSW08_01320 [archaeon]|nr:MAG: hypothetical protein JSW08_01320 [archaeon]
MAKIKAAQDRLFRNIFVCKKCGTKIKAQPKKIAEGKVRCRKCKRNAFRPKKKKSGK